MRYTLWLAGLLVFLLAGSASAQGFGNSNTRAANNGKVGLWNTTGLLSSPFRLTDFFTSFSTVLLPGGTRPGGALPPPSSPDYMSAFGYKRLGPPRPSGWWW